MTSSQFNVLVGVKLDKTGIQAQLDKVKGLKLDVKADLDDASFNAIKQKIENAKNVDVKVHAKFDQSSFKNNVRDKIESAKNIDAKVGVRFDQSEFKTKVREKINNSKNISVKVGAKLESDAISDVKAKIEKATADIKLKAKADIIGITSDNDVIVDARANIKGATVDNDVVVDAKANIKGATAGSDVVIDGKINAKDATVENVVSKDGKISVDNAVVENVTTTDGNMSVNNAIVNNLTVKDKSVNNVEANVTRVHTKGKPEIDVVANVTSVDKASADNVVYHAGIVSRLNKAETNGRFVGSNRGTGYYGTGHYFVDSATKPELDRSSSYGKLPYTSVDISQYDNLFKATTNEIAGNLHDFLRDLTRFAQGVDSIDVPELFDRFKGVFGDNVMNIEEFGSKLSELRTFMSNSDYYDRSDSVSTQFMKSLGYGGVDTRGTDYADTRYGTVIYDLKEESILQSNITDELQKQGQMLEKIDYSKGQVFDKDTDNKIQSELDEHAKRKEIQEEYNKSFDSTNYDKAISDLDEAQVRLREVNDAINRSRYEIDNADKTVREYARNMKDFGIDVSDEDLEKYRREITEDKSV